PFDEVVEVCLPSVALFVSGQNGTRLVLPSEIHLSLVIANLHPALGSENVHALSLGWTAQPVSQVAVELCPIRILIRDVLRIRRRLIRTGARLVQAANAVGHARMFLLSEQPADRVERMDSRVAKVCGAVFPEPVPVIVEMILVERTHRRRPQPQIVMNARRHRAVRGYSDRISKTIDDGLPRVDLAQSAVAQELDGLAENGAAAPLRSDRDDTVVSSSGFDHPSAFDDVMADGFLDVDVLARLARPDRHERMPVIGSRDGHGIDAPIVEHTPKIRLRLRISSVLLYHDGHRAL